MERSLTDRIEYQQGRVESAAEGVARQLREAIRYAERQLAEYEKVAESCTTAVSLDASNLTRNIVSGVEDAVGRYNEAIGGLKVLYSMTVTD